MQFEDLILRWVWISVASLRWKRLRVEEVEVEEVYIARVEGSRIGSGPAVAQLWGAGVERWRHLCQRRSCEFSVRAGAAGRMVT